MSDKIKDLARIRSLAMETLEGVCNDQKAPANARAMAARTMLELLGEIGRLQEQKPTDNKGLHEMTGEELDREISRLRAVSKGGIRSQARVHKKTLTKTKAKTGHARPKLRAARGNGKGDLPPWF